MLKKIIEDLTHLTDAELEQLNTLQAQDTLSRRARGATLLRLVIARIFGRDDIATRSHQCWVPHLTPDGKIAMLDVSRGIALNSLIDATEDVRALGLSDRHTSEYNALPLTLGKLAAPGEPSDSADPADSAEDDLLILQWEHSAHPITAPDGWLRINLPVSRGYEGDGRHKVPAHLYADDQRLTPRLCGIGYITHSGQAGQITRSLKFDHDEKIVVSHLPLTQQQRTRLSHLGKQYLRALIAHVFRLRQISSAALANATLKPHAQHAALLSNEEAIEPRVSSRAYQIPISQVAEVLAEDKYGAQWAANLGGDDESRQLLQELERHLHRTVTFETCLAREAVTQFIHHLYGITSPKGETFDDATDALYMSPDSNDARGRVHRPLVKLCAARMLGSAPVDWRWLTQHVNDFVMQDGPFILDMEIGDSAPAPEYAKGDW